MKIALRLAAVLLLAGPVSVASAHGLKCPPGGKPDWAHIPTGDEITPFYPERTIDRPVEGEVRLNCLADLAGLLRDCVVVAETPSGIGLGGWAVKLSHYFRLKRPGCPVAGSHVTFPIHFKPSDP